MIRGKGRGQQQASTMDFGRTEGLKEREQCYANTILRDELSSDTLARVLQTAMHSKHNRAERADRKVEQDKERGLEHQRGRESKKETRTQNRS